MGHWPRLLCTLNGALHDAEREKTATVVAERPEVTPRLGEWAEEGIRATMDGTGLRRPLTRVRGRDPSTPVMLGCHHSTAESEKKKRGGEGGCKSEIKKKGMSTPGRDF